MLQPRRVSRKETTNALNIPITPWAKLVRTEVRKISMMPKVASAYTLPISRPLNSSWMNALMS